MLNKEQKKLIIDDLVERFTRATGVYIVNFRKMNVAETNDWRKKVKDAGLEFKVAKNTLITKACMQIENFNLPEELLFGESGIVFAYDDPTIPAKLIKEYSDKNKDKLALKVATFDGQIFDGSELNKLATLPSKKDMFGAILGSINAPASGIHGVLNGIIRDIASLVEEVAKKQNAA